MKELFFTPLLNDELTIGGAQLFIKLENGLKKIINLSNFNQKYDYDYVFRNRLTKSGYKVYDRGLCYEFILVEAQLSNYI